MNDKTKIEQLPFTPFDSTLKEVLKKNQIKEVASWLLGKEENSILAQQSNSLWESSLSILFLINVVSIFDEKEETDLKQKIKYKSKAVARWLVDKKTESSDHKFISWEGVTWDTSVVIRAIAKALKEYANEFSDQEKVEIKKCITKGTVWLSHRFSKWETEVKYPFGPADVAQILATLISIRSDFPELYLEFLKEAGKQNSEIEIEIVRYLLHTKTEKTLTIPITSDEDEEVITYWWDDFFSTAEVVESIALFYKYYEADAELKKQHKKILHSTKQALVRACVYFEQSQVDGMWGSHIDTIKVIYAYVRIRSLIPQSSKDSKEPLIIPEIHTTFKALRWMCDEKQIFSDGSFLHTMFLTVFYSHALLEIYNGWEPANLKIKQLYDDVIWFSPVRTTPERSKRLAAELHIGELNESIDELKKNITTLNEEKETELLRRLRLMRGSIVLVISVLLFVFFGIGFKAFEMYFSFGTDKNVTLGYLALSTTLIIAFISVAWNWDKLFKK